MLGFLSCHFWNVYGFNSRLWLLRLCTCPTLASWRSAGQVRYLGRILKTGITHAGTCSRSLMSLTVNSPEVYFFMLPGLAVPESPPVNNGGRCIPFMYRYQSRNGVFVIRKSQKARDRGSLITAPAFPELLHSGRKTDGNRVAITSRSQKNTAWHGIEAVPGLFVEH